MILYANSDSYGVLSTGKTYADFIGEKLNAKVINNGLSGSCNDRIIRTSVRDLLEIKEQEVLAIIGLAHTNRTEYWSDTALGNDGHFKSIQPTNTLGGIAAAARESHIRFYNDEAEVTKLFLDLILFTSFLKLHNIKYLIWEGTMNQKPVDFTTPFIHHFNEQIISDSNILNLFDFSFAKYCAIIKKHIPYDYNKYQINGHHTEAAHKDFADYIIENHLSEV